MKGTRDQLTTLIKRAASSKQRVIVTRNGKAIAAIVPIEDLRLLEEIEDRKDIEDAQTVLAEIDEKGTVSWDEIKTELGLRL